MPKKKYNPTSPDDARCGQCQKTFRVDDADKTYESAVSNWRTCPWCGAMNDAKTARSRFDADRLPLARGGGDDVVDP